MSRAKNLLFFILLCPLHKALAQDQSLYNYQDLSHLYYAKQKDSLKKAWVCAAIVRQIANANRDLIPTDPLLLLDRNPSVNAYALGDNVLAVNLGLITFSKSREELALAIAAAATNPSPRQLRRRIPRTPPSAASELLHGLPASL